MPVRSLSSPILKWPDAQTVDSAVRRWTEKVARHRGDVLRVGYFGSYARGDWGVGSDLDLIIIVEHTDLPFDRRNVSWKVNALPVPVDVLIYTQTEWQALREQKARFYSMVMQEAVWILGEDEIC